MAIQLIPLVAAIVGGAVTIGTGTYFYKNYNEAEKAEPVPVISQPSSLLNGSSDKKAKEKLQVVMPLLPKFDLLRVEKDGSVLLSGSTMPNSAVEIVQDETVLGKTKSADNGDFVVVFDNPLKPGNYELYIRSTHKDGTKTRSLEAAIIAIPQEGGELLAMVSKPSGPSKLIQVSKLEPKAEGRTIEVPRSEKKAEENVVENAAKTKTVQEQVAEKKPVEVVKAKVEPVKEQEAVANVEPAAKDLEKVEEKAKADVVTQNEVKVASVETAKKVVEPTSVEVAKLETKQIEEVKVKPVEIAKVVPQLRPEKKTGVEKIVSTEDGVKVQSESVKSKPAPAIVKPVFLGAVEVENKKIYVAGTGQPDHIVNIYIDDKFVGNAKVDSQGAFLMESSSTLAFGNHMVRADMLGNANATVVARAQVPLIHDLPETPKEVVVAKAADANKDSNKGEVHTLDPLKTVQPAAKKLESTGEQLQVAKLEDTTSKVEATAKQLTRKLVEKDSKQVPEIVTPTKQKVAVVVQPAPVVAKKPKRVIRTGSSVIIRRGDNLWRISRRILGRGIRYSTIYQANRDQIKNPSLIFPGQIFKVPEKMVDVDTSEKS